MDTNRIRELLNKRDEIDEQIRDAVGKERKVQKCSVCSEEGHSSRTCPKKS